MQVGWLYAIALVSLAFSHPTAFAVHTSTQAIVANASPSFYLTATPSLLEVLGDSVNATLTAHSLSNYAGPIILSATIATSVTNGLSATLIPPTVTLAANQTASTTLTVSDNPDFNNRVGYNYTATVTVTGSNINGTLSNSVGVSVLVIAPRVFLSYQFSYTQSDFTSVIFENQFVDLGNLPDQVISCLIYFNPSTGKPPYQVIGGQPLTLQPGQLKLIDYKLAVPQEFPVGNSTLTAQVTWQALYHANPVAGQQIQVNGSVSVTQQPTSPPTSSQGLTGILGWATMQINKNLPLALVVLGIYASLITVTSILVVRQRRRHHEDRPPLVTS